jgi:hypothetical protein
MTETQIELSGSCRFTLTTYKNIDHKDVRFDVCLDYTEHSSDHWHSDRETSIPLNADKAREIVAFMHKAFPEIAPQKPVAWADPSDLERKGSHDLYVATERVDNYTLPLYTAQGIGGRP